MPILCHYDSCRYFEHRCTHPRKKENGGQFILPNFKPGKTCIWGEAKFDAANFLRAQISIADTNRAKELKFDCGCNVRGQIENARSRKPTPQHCRPSCVFWVYLYYKNEDDYKAVCDHPDRKGQGLPEGQMCSIAVPINRCY